MGNLVVADSEYIAMGKQYAAIGAEIETYITKYVKVMEDIVSRKMIEGETARAIAVYTRKVTTLKGQIRLVMRELKEQIDKFVKDIDRTDSWRGGD